MSKPGTYALAMGPLAPKLSDQLTDNGFAFDAKVIEHIQLDTEALSRLAIRGYLNDSIRDAIRRRIVKAVEAELQRHVRREGGST